MDILHLGNKLVPSPTLFIGIPSYSIVFEGREVTLVGI